MAQEKHKEDLMAMINQWKLKSKADAQYDRIKRMLFAANKKPNEYKPTDFFPHIPESLLASDSEELTLESKTNTSPKSRKSLSKRKLDYKNNQEQQRQQQTEQDKNNQEQQRQQQTEQDKNNQVEKQIEVEIVNNEQPDNNNNTSIHSKSTTTTTTTASSGKLSTPKTSSLTPKTIVLKNKLLASNNNNLSKHDQSNLNNSISTKLATKNNDINSNNRINQTNKENEIDSNSDNKESQRRISYHQQQTISTTPVSLSTSRTTTTRHIFKLDRPATIELINNQQDENQQLNKETEINLDNPNQTKTKQSKTIANDGDDLDENEEELDNFDQDFFYKNDNKFPKGIKPPKLSSTLRTPTLSKSTLESPIVTVTTSSKCLNANKDNQENIKDVASKKRESKNNLSSMARHVDKIDENDDEIIVGSGELYEAVVSASSNSIKEKEKTQNVTEKSIKTSKNKEANNFEMVDEDFIPPSPPQQQQKSLKDQQEKLNIQPKIQKSSITISKLTPKKNPPQTTLKAISPSPPKEQQMEYKHQQKDDEISSSQQSTQNNIGVVKEINVDIETTDKRINKTNISKKSNKQLKKIENMDKPNESIDQTEMLAVQSSNFIRRSISNNKTNSTLNSTSANVTATQINLASSSIFKPVKEKQSKIPILAAPPPPLFNQMETRSKSNSNNTNKNVTFTKPFEDEEAEKESVTSKSHRSRLEEHQSKNKSKSSTSARVLTSDDENEYNENETNSKRLQKSSTSKSYVSTKEKSVKSKYISDELSDDEENEKESYNKTKSNKKSFSNEKTTNKNVSRKDKTSVDKSDESDQEINRKELKKQKSNLSVKQNRQNKESFQSNNLTQETNSKTKNDKSIRDKTISKYMNDSNKLSDEEVDYERVTRSRKGESTRLEKSTRNKTITKGKNNEIEEILLSDDELEIDKTSKSKKIDSFKESKAKKIVEESENDNEAEETNDQQEKMSKTKKVESIRLDKKSKNSMISDDEAEKSENTSKSKSKKSSKTLQQKSVNNLSAQDKSNHLSKTKDKTIAKSSKDDQVEDEHESSSKSKKKDRTNLKETNIDENIELETTISKSKSQRNDVSKKVQESSQTESETNSKSAESIQYEQRIEPEPILQHELNYEYSLVAPAELILSPVIDKIPQNANNPKSKDKEKSSQAVEKIKESENANTNKSTTEKSVLVNKKITSFFNSSKANNNNENRPNEQEVEIESTTSKRVPLKDKINTIKQTKTNKKPAKEPVPKETATRIRKKRVIDENRPRYSIKPIDQPINEHSDDDDLPIALRRSKRAKIDKHSVPVYEYDKIKDYNGKELIVKKLIGTRHNKFDDLFAYNAFHKKEYKKKQKNIENDNQTQGRDVTPKKRSKNKNNENKNNKKDKKIIEPEPDNEPASDPEPEPVEEPYQEQTNHPQKQYDNNQVLDFNNNQQENINVDNDNENFDNNTNELNTDNHVNSPVKVVNNQEQERNESLAPIDFTQNSSQLNRSNEVVYLNNNDQPNSAKALNMYFFNKHIQQRTYEECSRGVYLSVLSDKDGLFKIDHNHSTKTNQHDCNIIYFVQKGRCIFSINGVLSIHNNSDIIKIPANYPYKIKSVYTEDQSYVYFKFETD